MDAKLSLNKEDMIMKKQYMNPAVKVYEMKPACIICTSDPTDPYDRDFGYTPDIDNNMKHLA
jgi:hypothetical protein